MFFAPATVLRRSAYAAAPRGFDRFLDDVLADAAPRATRNTQPSTQPAITQDEKSVTLTFDLPGVSREQLSIGVEANVVRIETVADAPRHYKMAYELPQDIDVAQSEAKLDNGVLTLKLGKLVPVSKAIQIAIN